MRARAIGGVTVGPRRRLDDDTRMPFGANQGKRLGEIPDSYWRWFQMQEWADQWPDLLEYAKLVEEEE